MKKLYQTSLALSICLLSTLSYANTLHSMNKSQVQALLNNHTLISAPTDNLDGKTDHDILFLYADGKGHLTGYRAQPLGHSPQNDQGTYNISTNGIMNFRWHHWGNKQLHHACIYELKNAYLVTSCDDNMFHTLFMKSQIRVGKHLS